MSSQGGDDARAAAAGASKPPQSSARAPPVAPETAGPARSAAAAPGAAASSARPEGAADAAAPPTPSQRDGMSPADEKRTRRRTCFFIDECGMALKLPKLPIMTAQGFFHKFFAKQSFKRHDRFVVAQACLFLAAKVEESAVYLKVVVATCHRVRFAGKGREPLDEASEEFANTKRRVLAAERAVLYAVDFDVVVENPLLYFIDLCSRLAAAGVVAEADRSKFAQWGLNFVSDSYRTSLCLQHEPPKIASGCAFITIVFMRALPTDRARLGALFAALAISERSLRSICTQMAEIYLDNKKCAQLIRDLIHQGHVPAALAPQNAAARGRPAKRARPEEAGAPGVTPSPPAPGAAS